MRHRLLNVAIALPMRAKNLCSNLLCLQSMNSLNLSGEEGQKTRLWPANVNAGLDWWNSNYPVRETVPDIRNLINKIFADIKTDPKLIQVWHQKRQQLRIILETSCRFVKMWRATSLRPPFRLDLFRKSCRDKCANPSKYLNTSIVIESKYKDGANRLDTTLNHKFGINSETLEV